MSPRARPYLLLVASTLVPFSTSGCLTDVGECDESRARQIVFLDTNENIDAENGEPMYAGQALLQRTCGNGQFCHAEGATGPARYGVPLRFDFDFGLVCTDGPCPPFDERIGRLERSQREALEHARAMLDAVGSGYMPPSGLGDDVVRRAPQFRQVPIAPGSTFSLRTHTVACDALPPGTCADGQVEIEVENPTLPELGTREGDEILRNWLACGAPVVESTGDPGSSPSGGDCGIPGEQGHAGTCVVRIPPPIEPPEPTWSSIFEKFVLPRCGQSCHSPSDAVNYELSGLNLSSQLTAYNALVSQPAAGQECGRTTAEMPDVPTLIVPGDPDASLFLQKMERTSLCGDFMPTGTSAVDPAITAVIRAWIEAGAPND